MNASAVQEICQQILTCLDFAWLPTPHCLDSQEQEAGWLRDLGQNQTQLAKREKDKKVNEMIPDDSLLLS